VALKNIFSCIGKYILDLLRHLDHVLVAVEALNREPDALVTVK